MTKEMKAINETTKFLAKAGENGKERTAFKKKKTSFTKPKSSITINLLVKKCGS